MQRDRRMEGGREGGREGAVLTWRWLRDVRGTMRPRSRSCPMPLNDAAAANKENEKKK
jgi:hypothetical protein